MVAEVFPLVGRLPDIEVFFIWLPARDSGPGCMKTCIDTSFSSLKIEVNLECCLCNELIDSEIGLVQCCVKTCISDAFDNNLCDRIDIIPYPLPTSLRRRS